MGIAAAQLALLIPLLGEGEPAEWRQFISLATLLPVLIFARHLISDQPWALRLDYVLALSFSAASLWVAQGPWRNLALVCATLIVVSHKLTIRWLNAICYLAGLCTSVRIFWLPGPDFRQPYVLFIGLLSLILPVAFLHLPIRGPALPKWSMRAFDLCAAAVFARLSARPNPIEVHHWTFVSMPAQMVREGAQLLWDAPPQYGVLNTWMLAHLPFG